MAITSGGFVWIAKPDDVSTSEMMRRFRDWLDANKIEPTLFTSELRDTGKIAFRLAFSSADQAVKFNRQFG